MHQPSLLIALQPASREPNVGTFGSESRRRMVDEATVGNELIDMVHQQILPAKGILNDARSLEVTKTRGRGNQIQGRAVTK